jgi:hypothetical protein
VSGAIRRLSGGMSAKRQGAQRRSGTISYPKYCVELELRLLLEATSSNYKSVGSRPVAFASRANMRGPISSPS